MGLSERELLPKGGGKGRIVAEYPYEDERGTLLYQVVRYEPKRFLQRRPGGRGDWLWGLGETPRVLFRLPQLVSARMVDIRAFDENSATFESLGPAPTPLVYVVEGEKDVLALERAGVLATCNAGGAGKWLTDYSRQLEGFKVVLVRDKDVAGYAHVRKVSRALSGVAESVRCVEAKEGKDAHDHLAAGFGLDDFLPVNPEERHPDEPAEVEQVPESCTAEDENNEDPQADEGAFPWTDLGNARRLEAAFGEDMRYCPDWGRWLHWYGLKWVEDTQENPGARAKAHALTDLLMRAPGKKAQQYARSCQGSRSLNAMLREAQALPGLVVHPSQLDTHDHLIGTLSGVLDLRTGKLVDDPKGLLITRCVQVEWNPEAECPQFEAFLKAIMRGRPELVSLLLRALGYSLSGSTKEQKFFLLYGERGRNGKTTLIELMQELMGERLCIQINKRLLTDSGRDSARFAMGVLEGIRMVYSNETRKNAKLDTEFLKDFVGGQTIKAERKGKDETQFRNRTKLWYAVNALPSADWDASFSDRVVPIPFEQSYYPREHESWRDGDLPPDAELPEKLRTEMPGIFRLIVAGYQMWQNDGLALPKEVRELLATYREENDSVGDWIGDRCEVDPKGSVRQTAAWKDYQDHVKAARPGSSHLRRADFKKDLLRRPGVKETKPQNYPTYSGLSLKAEESFGGHWNDDES